MERRGTPPYASQEPGTQGGAKEAASRAADESKQVAQTAGEQTREVAGAMKEQAAEVVQTAKEQGRSVTHEAREQLRQQADSQTERLAEARRNVGDQVHALAEGRVEEAGGVRDYARQAGTTVQEWAERVDSRGFQGLTRDLEQVARRRPGTFLAGAAAAGFLIGRIVRSSSASGSSAGGAPNAGEPRFSGSTPPRFEPAEPLELPVDVAPNPVAGEFTPVQSASSRGSTPVR
jgi:hypothetical protein